MWYRWKIASTQPNERLQFSFVSGQSGKLQASLPTHALARVWIVRIDESNMGVAYIAETQTECKLRLPLFGLHPTFILTILPDVFPFRDPALTSGELHNLFSLPDVSNEQLSSDMLNRWRGRRNSTLRQKSLSFSSTSYFLLLYTSLRKRQTVQTWLKVGE